MTTHGDTRGHIETHEDLGDTWGHMGTHETNGDT